MSDRRQAAIEALHSVGVVPVLRTAEPRYVVETAKALLEGGVRHFEITMSCPGALKLIETVRSQEPDIYVGVGTVLDCNTARMAAQAGADYVVSPVLLPGLVDVCHQCGIAAMPAGFTPTEIFTAWSAGADVVKVFPGRLATPAYIADLRGPLGHIRVMPTMEIPHEMVRDYIRAGAVAIGVGGMILDQPAIAEKRFGEITKRACAYVETVRDARAMPLLPTS